MSGFLDHELRTGLTHEAEAIAKITALPTGQLTQNAKERVINYNFHVFFLFNIVFMIQCDKL